MARTVSNDFVIADIESKIKAKSESVEFLRGYMIACYILGVIEKEELDELRKLLKKCGEKYKQMWEELDVFVMTANRPYSVANEMKNMKRRYFPIEEGRI